MPYEIKHKSRNECLIKYVIGDDPKHKKSTWLPIFIFWIIAVVALELSLIAAFIGAVLVVTALNKIDPKRFEFQIELNQAKNLVTIRKTKQFNPKLTNYPLNYFMGFELSERMTPNKSNHGAYVELYFKFENAMKSNLKTTQKTLLHRAKEKRDGYGRLYWKTPIQRSHYIIPLDNALEITEVIDRWLGDNIPKQSETASIEAPTPDSEPEVLRDFRDMDSGDKT